MKSEESKQTDEQVSGQLIANELQQLRSDLQQLSQQPRFDWKWFLSLAVPLVVPFIAAGIIGYFGIKADLKIIQRDVQHVQSDISEIKADLKETNKRIDAVEKRMQNFEVRLVKVEERLTTLDKRIASFEKKLESP